MKKMNLMLSVVPLLTVLSFASHAMPPEPERCPSVSSLKSAGFSYTMEDSSGYIVGQISQYGTKDTWFFGIPSITASSKTEALSTGFKALDTLVGSPKPTAITAQGVWACLYQTSLGYFGVAITPLNFSTKLNSIVMAQIHP